MTYIIDAVRDTWITSIRRGFAIVPLLLAMLTVTVAQTSRRSVTDGSTPLGLTPGAPAGSYALSGFDNINLFNGNPNFALPLLPVGGRGDAQYTITLQIDRHWQVDHFTFTDGSERTINVPHDGLRYRHWGLRPGYSPGMLIGRQVEVRTCDIGSSGGGVIESLTRLTFIAPDGTEYELRDQPGNGDIRSVFCLSPPAPVLRGTLFGTADGTSITFVSDSPIYDTTSNLTFPSGHLTFPNGLRYRIDNGRVTSMRDRNGNRLTFTYDRYRDGLPEGRVITITDSLNRQVTITYDVSDVAPYGVCDHITFKGFGGASRTIRVSITNLGNALRSGFTVQTIEQLFWGRLDGSPTTLYDPTIPSAVWLPDGRSYQLRYNSYGELARVVLPTGGAIEYDHDAGISGGSSNGAFSARNAQGLHSTEIYRRVVRRRVYPDGGTGDSYESLTTYSRPESEIPGGITNLGYVDVDHYGPQPTGTLLTRERHYFYGSPGNSFGLLPLEYANWRDGREYQTEIIDPSGTILQRVAHTWQQRTTTGGWSGDPNLLPKRTKDPQIVETTTTLFETNQYTSRVSKQSAINPFTGAVGIDQYNNQTDIWEYDFGDSEVGPLLRHTQTVFLTVNNGVDYAADANIHLRSLPVQKVVYDASGSVRSQTEFFYDNYGGFPLVDRPGIVQHDGGFHAGYSARGNLTGVILRNPDGSPSEIHLHNQYDIAGNLVKAVDGRGIPADFDFSDRFGSADGDARSNAGAPELGGGFTYAFPTKVTNALGHTAYTQYDYHLGAPVNTEDINGVVGSVTYNDPLDRPTQGIQARYKVGVGVPAERRQATVTYDDANRVITTTADHKTFNDNILTAKSFYDPLGRTRRSAAYEGSIWTITDARFDARSRVSQVSSPYRAADPGSASPPSGLWTKTDYDALSRVIRVTTPDDAHVDTAYSGNQVTVTDQAVKKRRSETDALGRLIKVTEDPGNLNYDTYYSYDVLGNLRQVTQGSQTRTFIYDSLSRLISATNPESGTMTYAYDPNGNLIEKTDARGVRTTMAYDALNRVKSRVYSGITPEGTAAANATPPVFYFCDDYSTLPSGAPAWPGTPSKGRLIGVTYGTGSEGTYYKYDALGRVATNHQRQGTSNYATTYTYNLAGGVTREDRGNRFRISSTYDNAGRLRGMDTSFTPFLSFVPRVKDISYTPFGAIQSETYGNGLIHTMDYNERLQLDEIGLGRPDNLESVFRINYIFGTALNVNGQDPEIISVHNNGNVARIKYFVSGTLQYSQTFQYDAVNRLRYAVEHNNGIYNDGARAWYQTFDYDRYGNRGMNVADTSDNSDTANSALQLADFSEANNRITRAGFVYDAAGNLIAEPGKSYTYDAENKIVTATVAGGVTSQYVYDGNGRRVKKIVGGVTTRFEYGAGGELLAERDETTKAVTKEYFYKGGELLATTKNGGDYEYATADHLGSPRVWTDGSGNVVVGGRHDYAPFGEELFAGYGTRTTDQGYAANTQADGQRKQFDAYERDAETGLDFAENRYLSSTQGRFTSPDPTLLSVNAFNPQSWNRYTFVLNNPLLYIDPLGLWDIEYNIRYKKNEDGSDKLDKNNNRIIDRVIVTAVKTKASDDGASLAAQLGLTGKEAAQFAERIGDGNNIRLADQGGNVGRVFNGVEVGLTEQAKWVAQNSGRLEDLAARNRHGPSHSDCSRTACEIGLGGFRGMQIGTNVLDPLLDEEARSVSPNDARVGDIIRYAKADNIAQHFANFIFRRDDGTPIAFSKSGVDGPYHFATPTDSFFASYGAVRGRNKGESGYYRRR